MTTDILVNTSQKDLIGDNSKSGRTFFVAEYGMHRIGSDQTSYLDVIIPAKYSVSPGTEDVYVKAPYIPVAGPLNVRFLSLSGTTYTIIQVFGENSLPMSVASADGTLSYMNACSIMGIDIDGYLRLSCNSDDHVCEVYKAGDSDLNIGNSDRQCVEMMMQCGPGKNYRYPITGIDAPRFIGSIIDRTTAAEDILRELEDDRHTTKDVTYNDETKRMRVETDEYNNIQEIEQIDTSTLDMEAFS